MRHASRLVTSTMLLESVWDFHFDPKTNIVETYMSRLRSKADRGQRHELIHTVRPLVRACQKTPNPENAKAFGGAGVADSKLRN